MKAGWGAVPEAGATFALVLLYIWKLRELHPASWLAIPAIMLVSHRMRHENAGWLGFRWGELAEAFWKWAPSVTLMALALLAAGILLDTLRPMSAGDAVLAWAAYLPWGLAQQYALNGYFLNRLSARVPARAAPVVSAALFAGAHTPNWFLMAVTLVAGYVSARVYRRQRNLYFLGVAHASLGFVLFLVVPDSISHHLRVGPGWFHEPALKVARLALPGQR